MQAGDGPQRIAILPMLFQDPKILHAAYLKIDRAYLGRQTNCRYLRQCKCRRNTCGQTLGDHVYCRTQ